MDAVCDAVEKAFLHLETLRDNRYFSSWFIRIVINECKAQLQKRQRALTLSQQLSGEPEHETPAREEVMDVQALLNQLAPLDRLLISLKFFDGCTLDEIAELTQLPVGTVKTKISSRGFFGLIRRQSFLTLSDCWLPPSVTVSAHGKGDSR
ncbi:RNA polymerase sigma factor [Brevibacillus thermoruber]|uniref:RNA polymerase sigma factor n=1 Tax=Brevibacillus thermoruber TaxID=33942 RepID=UPI00404114E3